MSCASHFAGDTFIHRLDPRAKVVVIAGFALVVALAHHPAVPLAGLLGAGLLTAWARIPPGALARRLLRVNVFLGLALVVLPLTMSGRPLLPELPVAMSREGLDWGLQLLAKGNAVVLGFTALVGTVEPFTLGHALGSLGLPAKLVQLLVLTLRYLDDIHHQAQTLRRAMRARAFRPRTSLHAYRSYGYLTAMLLVRSLERADRVLAAMRCRGYRGKFPALRELTFRQGDLAFGLLGAVACTGLIVLDLSLRIPGP